MTPDATGDALVATNPGWSRVAKGTAGQVLRSNGTTLVTANPRNEDLTTAYRFHVHQHTIQTLTSGAFATCLYDTSDFDDNSNFNLATGVFTAPVTGTYFFACSVDLSFTGAGGASWIFSLITTGGNDELFRGAADLTGEYQASGSTIRKMTTGDTAKAQAFQNTGANGSIAATADAMFFTGHLLSI